MKNKNEKLKTEKMNFLAQIRNQVEKLLFWEEISKDIEETSEEVEKTANLVIGVCTVYTTATCHTNTDRILTSFGNLTGNHRTVKQLTQPNGTVPRPCTVPGCSPG